MVNVRLRFFASAREAAGLDEQEVALTSPATIADALAGVEGVPGHPLDAVLARCSFLVNAVATTDRSIELGDGDVIDVMPPFAGG